MKSLVVSCLMVAAVAAAPPAPSGELLVRAETVGVFTLDGQDGQRARFVPVTTFRGAAKPLALRIDRKSLPKDVTRYFVFSQGDRRFGPPTDVAQVGQGVIGQRGFRGWLLYPIHRVHDGDVVDAFLIAADGTPRFDGAIAVDRLAAFVAQHPYRAAGE